MGVGRISMPLRGVGVIAMPDSELDTTQRIKVSLGASLLRQLVPSVALGAIIERPSEADMVQVKR
jgi:hypothetical protein